MTDWPRDPDGGTNGERTPVSAATPEQPVAGHPGVTAEGDRMRPSPPAGGWSEHLFGLCVDCESRPGIGPMGYCGECFLARFESGGLEGQPE